MEYKDTPWQDVLVDTRDYTVYKDKYPVTEGHVIKPLMVGVMNGLKMGIVMLTILDRM